MYLAQFDWSRARYFDKSTEQESRNYFLRANYKKKKKKKKKKISYFIHIFNLNMILLEL